MSFEATSPAWSVRHVVLSDRKCKRLLPGCAFISGEFVKQHTDVIVDGSCRNFVRAAL